METILLQMTAAPKSQLTANSMAKIDPQTGLIEGTTPVEKTGDPVADRLLAKQSIGTDVELASMQ